MERSPAIHPHTDNNIKQAGFMSISGTAGGETIPGFE